MKNKTEILRQHILEILELSREIQDKSFELCYHEDDNISSTAKRVNSQSHSILTIIERINSKLNE